MAFALMGTGALVVVGLLTGACSTSQPRGNCWRPGLCYYTSTSGEALFSCPHGERFAEGECTTTLRVGGCVTPTRTVHLYAPLHGLVTPDCESLAGPGAQWVRQ